MKTSNNSSIKPNSTYRKKGFIALVIVLFSVIVFLFVKAYILEKYHSTLDYFDNVKYVSTFDCPDNIEFDKLKQWFCPDTLDWDNLGKNYPCYISTIKYNNKYSTPLGKSKLRSVWILDYWLEYKFAEMVEYNCFKVRVNMYEDHGEWKTYSSAFNTVDWNVTHERAERFQDFVIKDFPLKEVIAYVYNGYTEQTCLYFFFDIDEDNMLLYYYKDIESFIFSNIGKLYLNDEHLKSDFEEWLDCLPFENVNRKWSRLITAINSEIGNSQFYKMKIKKNEFLKYCH